jgi:YD repeat-containing protein
MAKIKTSGKPVKEQAHQELVKKMKRMSLSKFYKYMDKDEATVDGILKALEAFDEVVVKLDTHVTLRVCRGFKYYINDTLYGVKGTSTEQGFTYDSNGQVVSVNYTGEQKFRTMLENLLK